MNITVRKAKLEDAPAATGVYISGFLTYIPLDPIVCWQNFWAHEPPLREMERDIETSLSGEFNNKAVHVLEIDGVIVGFCRASRLNKTTTEINQIALRQDLTNMGLGQHLMAEVAKDYQTAGCQTLVTNGTITCNKADRFFRNIMGMTETGSGCYVWNNGEIAYITYEAAVSSIAEHSGEIDECAIKGIMDHHTHTPVLTKKILQEQAAPIYEQACATLPANRALATHLGFKPLGLFHAFKRGDKTLSQVQVLMKQRKDSLDPKHIRTQDDLEQVDYVITPRPAAA